MWFNARKMLADLRGLRSRACVVNKHHHWILSFHIKSQRTVFNSTYHESGSSSILPQIQLGYIFASYTMRGSVSTEVTALWT